jgi:urea transporter
MTASTPSSSTLATAHAHADLANGLLAGLAQTAFAGG